MNNKAQNIENRLSLRTPQSDSLQILEQLADVLGLKKDVNVAAELSKVQALYPTCSDFERDFPSVCFSLATGVGKTRLMGAFISYLFTAKGIKNFFVLAPNLTIYEKLKAELSEPNHPKYVFKGISEFAVDRPVVISGDDYTQASSTLFSDKVSINIFNISKINSEVRGGKEPRIKRLSEYLGESYFNYLASLPDLVLLMDESHHYRADAGLRAINELKPILGLELTATPIDANGNKFKNVVFDYPLALALKDGFVKEPAVATRRNFNPIQYRNDPKELDLIKLEDGIRIHEDTKVALDIYSRDSGRKLVKPFVLVVTQNTDHAKEIHELIESDKFFEGRYKGKVIEVHSRQTGEEKEENIEKLLALEKPENTIEIVIHVNMLKEGWDIANLYTIIPLRAANSVILTEQTIGRGLRLPYGERTGDAKVDKLTIIAHDKFQTIVDAANDPNSIIRLENIIEIDPEILSGTQEVIVSTSSLDFALEQQRTEIATITNAEEKEKAELGLETQKIISETIAHIGSGIKNINDLKTDEVQKIVYQKMAERIDLNPQKLLPNFKAQIMERAKEAYTTVVDKLLEKTIPIPRILIQRKDEIKSGFHDFDLDISSLNYQPVTDEIIRRTLRTNTSEILHTEGTGIIKDLPENILVNELINYPEVDYDREAALLYKLAKQAIAKLGVNRCKEDLENIVWYYKREIGKYIYAQLQQHFYLEESGFEEPVVYPYTKIEPHNYSKFTADSIFNYSETINPTSAIPTKIFGGFKKACHNLYKFDSKTEKDFASILESDRNVLKWLRQSPSQFRIYWAKNSKQYYPDFVVETSDSIYLVETKAQDQVGSPDVLDKKESALRYCKFASDYNAKNGGKPWKYVLIPHTEVSSNMSFDYFVDRFQQELNVIPA